jgi:hypothetical protein
VTFPELYTADHTPLIGRDPGTGAFLALGFSGKGFKMSAGADLGTVLVVGDVAYPVELVLDAPVSLHPRGQGPWLRGGVVRGMRKCRIGCAGIEKSSACPVSRTTTPPVDEMVQLHARELCYRAESA